MDSVRDYVLLVDDEVEIRSLVALVLAREGYAVREASNGRDALVVLQEAVPALIVLDLYMPGMSGMEFLDELERLPAPRPPVVLFSGLADYVPEDLSRRVAAVVGKPVRVASLLALVHEHWQSALHQMNQRPAR
jgi:CheY-like chemotaxis protein